jgi:hypothetical protein
MAWLESLAAQQGANPDELLTTPETRPAEAPAWVVAEQQAAEQPPIMQAPASEAPAPEPPPMEALPTRPLAPPPPAETAPPAEPPAPAEPAPETGSLQPDLSRLERLSERLAASRRAKEAEIEARFAQQRAEQEEARRLVWESMQAKKAAVESAIESMETRPAAPETPAEPPAAAPPLPARGHTGPLTPPAPPRRVTAPLPKLPEESDWVPPRRVPAPSRFAGQPPEVVLAEARSLLRQQDEPAATAALDHLVEEGQLLDTVIVELEPAAQQPAASVPLLRVLGDAYARSNQLDQALQTYRQALRRL